MRSEPRIAADEVDADESRGVVVVDESLYFRPTAMAPRTPAMDADGDRAERGDRAAQPGEMATRPETAPEAAPLAW
ncbi:hypothetical protein GCM10023238_04240 [Streptomyces heliomycini]